MAFTIVRSQADLSKLVPCGSSSAYLENLNGCAEVGNWDFRNGIYGDNYARKAIERGMKVILTFKNASWNCYPGAPEDEETVPHDFRVWQDMLTKLINHYQGGIAYLELYNEVDRDPQFRVEGSPYTRKEGYQMVLRHAARAIDNSQYPDTPFGSPAAALIGAEQVKWMLEDDEIRHKVDLITFHDYDNPEYPAQAVDTYQNLMEEYGRDDLKIIRTSFVPEYERNLKLPGTLYPAPIARHLAGALKDGLLAMGLWEIQNKTDENDVRYWFDGDSVVATADLYRILSLEAGLGKGPSEIFATNSPDFTDILAARNEAGELIIMIPADYDNQGLEVMLEINNLPFQNDVVAIQYQVGLNATVKNIRKLKGTNGQHRADLTIPDQAVLILQIKPN